MDGQHFADILVGNDSVWIGLATVGVLSWLWFSYITSPARKLDDFPTLGSNLPILSLIDTVKFITKGHDILDAGVRKWPGGLFKIPTPYGWWVIVTDLGCIEDLRKAPEHILSTSAPIHQALQVQYTLGPEIAHNPYHIPLTRTQLNRALPELLPDIYDEMEAAFKDYIPATDDWTSIKALDTSLKVIARTTNRIFVGYPLCRDPDWVRLNTEFTKHVVTIALLLRVFPPFLRPLINYLATPIHRDRCDGLKHLRPLIAARRKEREAKGNDYPEKPVDFLSWFLDEAQGEENQDEYLVRRMLTMNFASLNTTSMAFTHALYYLAAYPQYCEPLREEIEKMTKRDGWTKTAVDQMTKLDSFAKESQRLRPLGGVVLMRKTLEEFTFSNGRKVPAGTSIMVSSITQTDPEVFEDPSRFDGFRFVKMKERAVMDGYPDKKFDMVTANSHSLSFGLGKTTCPGRFLAASQIKMMLAYVIMTYDLKLTDGVHPPDLLIMHNRLPNRTAEVLFRRRGV